MSTSANTTTTTTKATENDNIIFFEATLVSAYQKSQATDTGKVSKNKLNMTTDDKVLWGKLEKVYENTPKKYIPEWFKNRDEKNMVSLKSSYDIHVKIDDTGEKFTFDEFVDRGLIRGAKIKVKANIKDYCIYPSAFVVYEDGEPYDAFEGF